MVAIVVVFAMVLTVAATILSIALA